MKISNNQKYECLGLIESVIGSEAHPGSYFTTVKCMSKSGKARIIDKEELFRILSRTKAEVLYSVRQKISFMAFRLGALLTSNKINLLASYYDHGDLNISFTNEFESEVKIDKPKEETILEKHKSDLSKKNQPIVFFL